MFIHLGGEKIIRTSELIAIFDISIDKNSKLIKPLSEQPSKNERIEVIGDEEPKSIVLTQNKTFYSPISSATLKKRANQLIDTLNEQVSTSTK
ncbi:extracellular matrix regulator RemB [Ferviditalea candida]|uniref:Extracellular matrix/biofilm biosynthesis regulator RemA family protein n=1 Tax=Ferviditalea candida TaxID=3108399 RepID=A0ABU5ZL50_9BACL|nr:extracellular matrix/biofilm biosynthesis regulator RemA family protein [Paenibacillaceae bacterium T2]